MSEINELVADIVSAYVSKNSIGAGELPALITNVFNALSSTAAPPEPEPVQITPAVSVRRSITPDAIICLEDGRKFKSLKRHLQAKYGLTPAAYREKWGLPPDYPMVAPSYAASRSALAKSMGLGQQGRKARVKPAAKGKVTVAKAAGKPRGRPPKAIDPATDTFS